MRYYKGSQTSCEDCLRCLTILPVKEVCYLEASNDLQSLTSLSVLMIKLPLWLHRDSVTTPCGVHWFQ